MNYVNAPSFANKTLNRLEIKSGRSRLLSRPVHIAVEPTLQCNSNCVMCNRNAVRKEEVKKGGFLSWSTLEALSPFLRWAETVLFGGFGEPLLHPEYTAMVRYIKDHGPEVYFFTNGMLLTRPTCEELIDAGVDLISVSFGGASPETFRRIRGVEMGPIVENLKAFRKLREEKGTSKPAIHLNVVAMNSVLAELDEILLLASELGITEVTLPNLGVQRQDLSPESPWNDLENARKLLASAEKTSERYGIRLVPPDLSIRKLTCHQLFKSLTVTWDGRILSCPLERYILGNVTEAPLRKIWNDPAVVDLRKRFLTDGIESTCPNCLCWDNRPEAFLHPHENSRAFAQDLRKTRKTS